MWVGLRTMSGRIRIEALSRAGEKLEGRKGGAVHHRNVLTID